LVEPEPKYYKKSKFVQNCETSWYDFLFFIKTSWAKYCLCIAGLSLNLVSFYSNINFEMVFELIILFLKLEVNQRKSKHKNDLNQFISILTTKVHQLIKI